MSTAINRTAAVAVTGTPVAGQSPVASSSSAAAWGWGGQFIALASATANVNNSTAVIDTTLTLPVLNGATYLVEALLDVISTTVADVRVSFGTPTTSGSWGSPNDAANTRTNWTTALTVQTSTRSLVLLKGYLSPSADGDLLLRFAQGTSTVTDTSLQSGSYLRLVRVA